MKRYMLFGGMCYYPSGGWEDYVGAFHLFTKAQERADKPKHEGDLYPEFDWAHIVDMTTFKIISLRDGYPTKINKIEWRDPT